MLDITFEETKVYQEIREEALQDGRQAGLQEEATSLVFRLLKKRFGDLTDDMSTAVSELPLTVLEELGEALLDFSDVAELQDWLASHSG